MQASLLALVGTSRSRRSDKRHVRKITQLGRLVGVCRDPDRAMAEAQFVAAQTV